MLIGLLLLMAGCASLSEEQCHTGDWSGIGYADGADGRNVDQLTEHRQSCAELGIVPDEDAYRAGRDAGLRKFCTARNGFARGARGSGYERVCPALLEFGFMQGYEEGLALFRYEQAVTEIRNAIDTIDRHIRDIEYQLLRIDSRLRDQKVEDNERSLLLRDARRLAFERERLLRERSQFAYEANSRETALLQFRHQLRGRPGYADWTGER